MGGWREELVPVALDEPGGRALSGSYFCVGFISDAKADTAGCGSANAANLPVQWPTGPGDPGSTLKPGSTWTTAPTSRRGRPWRNDARQIVDDRLALIADDLEAMAVDVGADLYTQDLSAGPWPRVGLRRPGWEMDGEDAVRIVVQRERAKLLTPGDQRMALGGGVRPHRHGEPRAPPADSSHRQAICRSHRSTPTASIAMRYRDGPGESYEMVRPVPHGCGTVGS